MIALFFVLIVSLLIAGFFLSGFLWSVKKDQFEDKEGAAMRMLHDDGTILPPVENDPERPIAPRS